MLSRRKPYEEWTAQAQAKTARLMMPSAEAVFHDALPRHCADPSQAAGDQPLLDEEHFGREKAL